MSAAGDAHGTVAVSGTGDAGEPQDCEEIPDEDHEIVCLEVAWIAVSGTGDARADDLALAPMGHAEANFVAVSGTGDASSRHLAVAGSHANCERTDGPCVAVGGQGASCGESTCTAVGLGFP